MNLQMEPPEKKKKSFSAPPSFSSLPDETAVNCLARISSSYYLRLSIVSKSFRSLVSSTELYVARSHIGNTERCLYVWFMDYNHRFPQWFRHWINPNRTLPKSSMIKKKKKKTIGQLSPMVPIPSSNFPSLSKSTVVVGSEIYVIGGPVDKAPSSAVGILDSVSHTWRDAPSMNVARAYAASCFHDGRIYVMGGCKEDESWAEVFDIKTQTWERLPDPGIEAVKSSIHSIVEMEGKIKFVTFIDTCFAYDTKQRKWECCGNESAMFPRSECVIENVSYRYGIYGFHGRSRCEWYDIKDGNWKEVKGLGSLRNKYKKNGGSSSCIRKLASCGGKLLLIWEGCVEGNPNDMKKIWYAEFVVEKRDGGEVWGNLEWVDVVRTVPASCMLFHCLAVSI